MAPWSAYSKRFQEIFTVQRTQFLKALKRIIVLVLVMLCLSIAHVVVVLQFFPDSSTYQSLRSYGGYFGYGWCRPFLPTKVTNKFKDEQSWDGDNLFWENFPCSRDSYRVYLPEGSPPPKVNRSNLIVSAFFDIGRSNWVTYQRPSENYFSNMEQNMLTLRNPMVFFTTPEVAEEVVKVRRRKGLMDRTMVIAHDLHCASQAWMLPSVVDNMCNDRTMKDLWAYNPHLDVPERQQPWYNLVMWMKAGVVRAAATLPHAALASEWITWLDAGCRAPVCEESWLGGIYLHPSPWARKGRIRISNMGIQDDSLAKMSPVEWVRKHHVLFMGGCFGMTRAHAIELMDVFLDTVQWLFVRGVIDTDQTVFAWMWTKKPEIFDLHYLTGDYQKRLSQIVKGFAGL